MQYISDVLHNQLDGHRVLPTPGDNHVGVLHGRKTELLKSWLDKTIDFQKNENLNCIVHMIFLPRVLVDDSVQISFALLDVTHNSAR